jgi:glycerophosphoryl diester phosphodiesterase
MAAVELIAHRGWPRHYPENTLIGFDAAADAGALYVETDVQLSSDGVPFLFHDRDMKRVCGMNRSIADHSAAQLERMHASESARFGDAFAGEPIPRLTAFVQWLLGRPDIRAFVEIKRNTIEHFGIDTVLERVTRELAPVADRCVLISFSYDFLREARRQGRFALGVVLVHWRDRKADIIREVGPEYLFADVGFLPRWRPWNIEGPQLAVYEVDNPTVARRLLRRGARFIETFSVGEMIKALA